MELARNSNILKTSSPQPSKCIQTDQKADYSTTRQISMENIDRWKINSKLMTLRQFQEIRIEHPRNVEVAQEDRNNNNNLNGKLNLVKVGLNKE